MKKILTIVISGSLAALAMQSCNQPTVDTAKEMAKIDSMANAKLSMYRDSLRMVCMTDVMMMAKVKSDSLMQAYMKNPGKAKPPKPAPTTTTTVTNPGKKGEEGVQNPGKKGTDTTKAKNTGKKGVPPKIN